MDDGQKWLMVEIWMSRAIQRTIQAIGGRPREPITTPTLEETLAIINSLGAPVDVLYVQRTVDGRLYERRNCQMNPEDASALLEDRFTFNPEHEVLGIIRQELTGRGSSDVIHMAKWTGRYRCMGDSDLSRTPFYELRFPYKPQDYLRISYKTS